MKPIVYVGFTTSPDIISRLIRAVTHDKVSHVFLAWRDPNFECVMTIGANFNGVTMQPLDMMLEDFPVLWSGPRDLWPGILANKGLINKPYGYAHLLGMFIVEAEEHLLGRISQHNVFTSARVICSEYVCMILRSAGYDVLPGRDPGTIDPGDLEDCVKDLLFAHVSPQ